METESVNYMKLKKEHRKETRLSTWGKCISFKGQTNAIIYASVVSKGKLFLIYIHHSINNETTVQQKIFVRMAAEEGGVLKMGAVTYWW